MEAFIVVLLVVGGIWLLIRRAQAKGAGAAAQGPKHAQSYDDKLAPTEGLRSGQSFTLEGTSYRLSGNGRVSVVGESYRRREFACVVEGHRVARACDWDNTLRRNSVLIPEPTNEHDKNAVRVLLEVGDDWAHVGYLSADDASELAGRQVWEPTLTTRPAESR